MLKYSVIMIKFIQLIINFELNLATSMVHVLKMYTPLKFLASKFSICLIKLP